jgi:hypothetical protein
MSDTIEGAVEATVSVPDMPTDDKADRMRALLDQWMVDCVHNSPASRDTEVFNHLATNAMPELLRRLIGA